MIAPRRESKGKLIIGVAIKHRLTGDVFFLLKPNRHSDVIRALVERGDRDHAKGEQGFLTDDGTFLNRWQAARCVKRTRQHTTGSVRLNILLSEDLW